MVTSRSHPPADQRKSLAHENPKRGLHTTETSWVQMSAGTRASAGAGSLCQCSTPTGGGHPHSASGLAWAQTRGTQREGSGARRQCLDGHIRRAAGHQRSKTSPGRHYDPFRGRRTHSSRTHPGEAGNPCQTAAGRPDGPGATSSGPSSSRPAGDSSGPAHAHRGHPKTREPGQAHCSGGHGVSREQRQPDHPEASSRCGARSGRRFGWETDWHPLQDRKYGDPRPIR